MKYQSALLTAASGSIGGMTASHNRGGLYLRSRVIPTDPNTSQQQTLRAIVASLANVWANNLSAAQRAGWDLYAANVPVIDTLGNSINLSGINMFIRSLTPRVQAGQTVPPGAPTIFDKGSFTPVTAISTAAGQTLEITFDVNDAWVAEDDAAMLVYVSRPQNPGINYFRGPYRLSLAIEGDSVTPPTSPASAPVPFPVVAGQKVFYRVQVTRSDQRLSQSQFDGTLVT